MVRLQGLGATALLALVVSCGAGCSSGGEDVDEAEDAVSAADATAALEIHALDIWARALDARDVKLTVQRNGRPIRVNVAQKTTVFLRQPGTYAIRLEAPQHQPLDLSVRYDGGAADTSASLDEDGAQGAGTSLAHVKRTVGGRRLPAHVVYMGLRHKWFSAEGRPSRKGNEVQLLMDGEEAWATVHEDLVKANKEVLVSTWWWESDFELVRSPAGTAEAQRWGKTILGTLEAIPAQKKVLVGEFVGQDTIFSLFNTDSKLRAHATKPDDHFEMMSQANETRGKFKFEVPAFPFGDRVKQAIPDAPAFAFDGQVSSSVPPHDVDLTQVPFGLDLPLASYHQKFMVVDHDVAFVGGMNLKAADWDTSRHEIYDAQRMNFGAWDTTRGMVTAKNRPTDNGPRKDYMVRVEGPAAQDVADVFHDRWEHLRKIRAKNSEATTSFEVVSDIAPRAGGMDVQVTATLPAPFHEHAIAETWFNAVRNAERYILIEDQYFRMPMIHDALVERMDKNEGLKLVVITKPVGRLSPECVHSQRAGNLFANRYGGRFLSLQLRTFDHDTREFANIDVHSKMLIVDDVFMSVGSANKNNRGMVYEAELNVAIVDPTVAAWRKRIVTNLLGGEAPSDGDGWVGQLESLSRSNDRAFGSAGAEAPPRGFVYGLGFGPESACTMQSVGPDAT